MNTTNTQTELSIVKLEIKDGKFFSSETSGKNIEILNKNFDWLNQLIKDFSQKNKDPKHVVIACFNVQEQKERSLAEQFIHGRNLPSEGYYCTFASKETLASCMSEDGEVDFKLSFADKDILLVLFKNSEYTVFSYNIK